MTANTHNQSGVNQSGGRISGRHHWIVQRLSAIVLVPLTIWFVFTVIALSGASYEQAVAHFDSSIRVTLMILFVASIFYHGALGLEVVIEDYVADLRLRSILIMAVKTPRRIVLP